MWTVPHIFYIIIMKGIIIKLLVSNYALTEALMATEYRKFENIFYSYSSISYQSYNYKSCIKLQSEKIVIPMQIGIHVLMRSYWHCQRPMSDRNFCHSWFILPLQESEMNIHVYNYTGFVVLYQTDSPFIYHLSYLKEEAALSPFWRMSLFIFSSFKEETLKNYFRVLPC